MKAGERPVAWIFSGCGDGQGCITCKPCFDEQLAAGDKLGVFFLPENPPADKCWKCGKRQAQPKMRGWSEPLI
jgi:hypothetical protein